MEARPLLQRAASVRLRLTLWNVAIVALVLFALGGVVHYTTQAAMSTALNHNLELRSRPFVEHWKRFDRDRLFVPPWYRPGRPRPAHPPPGPFDNPANAIARFWPRTLDTRGQPYLPWGMDRPWDDASVARAAQGEHVFTSVWIGSEHIRVLSFPLHKNHQVVGVMQVASSLAAMDQAGASLSATMLTLSPLMLLACGLVGAFITGRAMRPVRTIAQAAGRIGAGNVSERLPVIGNDDFAALAVTVNGMLGRLDDAFTQLEQAYEQQRRFTADASHELRTPLTAIKGYVSLALAADRPAADYRKALEDTNRASDNMRHIVDELMFLARSDADQLAIALRPIDVHELLQAAADAAQGSEEPAISIDAPADLPPLCADPNHLLRALVNLLVNALRHTPANGAVTLGASVSGGEMELSVRDTGEGIAEEHLPHVCERFYRVDASRSRAHGGTGLGLAICRCIAEAHGGRLKLESRLGQGTTASIILPVSDAQT
jgi:two-component system, OmpR family, sensor kinase